MLFYQILNFFLVAHIRFDFCWTTAHRNQAQTLKIRSFNKLCFLFISGPDDSYIKPVHAFLFLPATGSFLAITQLPL